MKHLEGWLLATANDPSYWAAIYAEAKKLNADGCTGVLDIFRWTCLEHDIHFRTHKFLDGTPITFDEANYVFRVRIKQTPLSWNPLTWIKYPVSWTRWAGVTALGKRAWNHD